MLEPVGMILAIKHPKQKDGEERKISERRGEKKKRKGDGEEQRGTA